ncbi:MAG: tol-pal system protein YbgF [Endozoicomonas sp.]
MSLKPVKSSIFILAALLSGSVLAQVPVVESRPTTAAASVQGETRSSVTPSATGSSGTAHLLNLIDELRGEIMSLRGQVEEQGYRIGQLQQENRDRYLDLDERITRLGAGEAKASQEEKAPAVLPEKQQGSIQSPESVSVDVNAQLEAAAAKKQEADYNAAFALIGERKFDSALSAMRQLLEDYPQGRYSDNAQYWLGEVQMAQGRYREAHDDFQLVLNDYPQSAKVPDAAYKLGRLYHLLGDQAKARKHLESVISDYPDTAAARLSDTYLRNM